MTVTSAQKIGPADKFRALGSVGMIERVRQIKRRLSHHVATYLTNRWDLKHRVETSGRVPLNSAGIEVAGDHSHFAYDVISTPPRVFAYVASFFPNHREDYSYLDIGSGKGRTVLLASELGFKACIGVEFANFACDVARKNLQSYVGQARRSPCEILNSCATKFTFPDGNLVLFLNNPFSLELWPEMARRIESVGGEDRAVTAILIGSFPDAIRGAADLMVQSGVFTTRTQGVTPRFWDSYAPFHFIVLDQQR